MRNSSTSEKVDVFGEKKTYPNIYLILIWNNKTLKSSTYVYQFIN